MGRQRKQSPAAAPADDMTAEDHEALEQAEMEEGEGDQPEEPPTAEANPLAGPKAQPLAIAEKRVKVPKRDLGGMYRCKTCVRKNGTRHRPGTELQLTDAEARHYLQHEAVEALD